MKFPPPPDACCFSSTFPHPHNMSTIHLLADAAPLSTHDIEKKALSTPPVDFVLEGTFAKLASLPMQLLLEYTSVVMTGDEKRTSEIEMQADKLPSSAPTILKKLCTIVPDEGLAVQGQLASLTARMTLPPDVAFAVCDEIVEEIKESKAAAMVLTAYLWQRCKEALKERPEIKPADFGTRGPDCLLAVASAPADALPLRVFRPQLDDKVFVTVFDTDPDWHPFTAQGFASTASKGMHFMRSMVWKIPSSFLFFYLAPDRPLDLTRAIVRFSTGQSGPASQWGLFAAASLEASLSGLGVARADDDDMIVSPVGRFVLFSWNDDLHGKCTQWLTALFRERSYHLKAAREVTIPALGRPAASLLKLFSADSTHERAVVSLVAQLPDMASSRKRIVDYVQRQADLFALEKNSDSLNPETANRDVVNRLGLQAASDLYTVATLLDYHGSVGVAINRFLTPLLLSVWDSACSGRKARQVPLMGDAISRQANGSETELVGQVPVKIFNVSSTAILKRFDKRVPLLSQLPEAIAQLGEPPEGCVRLYHGTTISAATSLVRDGVDVDRLQPRSDFGAALFTTPDLPYALYCAFLGTSSQHFEEDCAVVVYDVTEEALLSLPHVPKLRARDEALWRDVVAACRHGFMHQYCRTDTSFAGTWRAARVIDGFITGNATEVDRGLTGRPSRMYQYAFPRNNVEELENITVARQVLRFSVEDGEWN